MKKIHLLLLMVFGILFTACENQNCWLEEGEVIPAKPKKGTHINLGEALVIAENAVGRGVTRSTTSAVATVDYVLNNVKTRSQDLPDTLAYVINYADEGGFAIISADNRVAPLLAFSDTGHFSWENEAVVDVFIANIGPYLQEHLNTTTTNNAELPNFVEMVAPMIVTQVGQTYPFNKYVAQEHPGCPAGCVPVAVALALMNTQDNLLGYHGSNWNFKSIRRAMKDIYFPPSTDFQSLKGDVLPDGTNMDIEISYLDAIDVIAKLLFELGKDMNTEYDPEGSGTYMPDGINLLKKLSPNVTADDLQTFTMEAAYEHIMNNEIIVLHGDATGSATSALHAWLADGLGYMIYGDGPGLFRYYIHCDWGWQGKSNGYYNGELFDAGKYIFVVNSYLGVKNMRTD